ncbi:hypothetical protein [Oricola indica]|jgi:hypothetical protein|uniref:hypothetical protein n=1 Tax=Oricola indica TaxID=2872591 RepID=UPI001CBD57BC|nr:hypothetical protein [Oricola indica]
MEQRREVNLPSGMKLGKFRPVAYYDKHMDCLRVFTRDCSVTEKRVDGFITLHKCNHRSDFDPEYVGFTLKGIRHLFDTVGLDLGGVYTLTEIVDRIVKFRPGSSVSTVLELVYKDYKDDDIHVELDGELAA